MGSDASVVRASQRTLAMRDGIYQWPQYAAYATVGSWTTLALVAMFGSIFNLLASSAYGAYSG
jgi:hypothetical protein